MTHRQSPFQADRRIDWSVETARRLGALSGDARADIAATSRRLLTEACLSFNPFDDQTNDRSRWRFDPAPVVLEGDEWRVLAEGAVQRARLIDAVLADVYGQQELIREGLLPPYLLASPKFIRGAGRWPEAPPGRLTLYSVDVARRPDGIWVVLDDHAEKPEGLGWAVANRVALSQAASELFVDVSPRRLGGFMNALSATLTDLAGGEGRRGLLTTGASDPAYFSHAFIARYLDLMLVEPADLTARDGAVHVKTLEGLRQIDVALRMTPSIGIDPVSAPGPSALAPPGVLHAARMSRVRFANMIGAGVADGRALARWSAPLTRRLLGEEPILFEGDTVDLGDPAARDAYLDAPDQWRVAPVSAVTRPGGAPPPDPLRRLSTDERARLLKREGWRYVARGRTALSTAPAFAAGDGRAGLIDKPFALRLFVTLGPDGYEAFPGGLAQNCDEGATDGLPWHGDAKDVWVVQPEADPTRPATDILSARRSTAHMRRTGLDLLSRVADNLFWLGRYVERAETGFRILKLVLDLYIDAPRRQRDPDLLADMLEILLGDGEVEKPRNEIALLQAIARLAYDPKVELGLRQSIDGVMRNAANTRSHLSRDGWRDVAELCADPVWRRDLKDARPLTLTPAIEEGIKALSAFSGAAHENMARNFAWRFLELGRRIERGTRTAAMMRALLVKPDEREAEALFALLQLCDSFFSYRARYLTTPEAASALDLLALDEINPRSIAFQLVAIEEAMATLPSEGHRRTSAHKTALTLLTEFRVMDAPALAEEAGDDAGRVFLAAALDRVQHGLEEISDRLAATYFAHAEAAATQVAMTRIGDAE